MIETVAPIPLEELKKFFQDKDNVKFLIDYDASSLKGDKFLTYVSNLDVPANIKFDLTQSEHQELLASYMNSPNLIRIEALELAALKVLFQAKGFDDFGLASFVDQNRDIVDAWIGVIESLSVFNMTTLKIDAIEDFTSQFPQEDGTPAGVNFVNLLKHEAAYLLFQTIDRQNLKYYTSYFEKYMFKGANLFSFWANQNNPLFLLTVGIAQGQITAGEQP